MLPIALGRFACVGRFLVCLIYARIIIASLDMLRRALPKGQQYLSEVLLHLITAVLFGLTLTWRDWKPMNMCNKDLYSEGWCTFSSLIFYQKQQYDKVPVRCRLP